MSAKKSTSTVATPPKGAEDTDATGRFEKDLQELESIVEQMENGDLPLEKSLQLFERGVVLGKQCRASLQQAEQRIRELSPDDGADDPAPPDDDPNDTPDEEFPF